ncbi:MAG: hypothetical protein ISS43_02700 [Candidatus Omnitrophica bacterium]|nr:hypothetical protein [Candidatus Omnitrophota bacterium]
MRRFIVYSLWFMGAFVLFLFCASLAQAAPVGSPAGLLKKGQWDFAIEGGYLSERPMESGGKSDYTVSISHGYHSRSYGLTERLMITGKAGGMYAYLYDETTPGVQTKTSLSGGLGLGLQLKGIIFKNEISEFEWDGAAQFLYLSSHHKRSGKANADWYEWQISSCLAKVFGILKPYAGVKFSVVDLDHDDGKGNKTSYDEDSNLGPFVGTDIYFGEDRDIVINLEAGFLLGTEFYGGIRYRF